MDVRVEDMIGGGHGILSTLKFEDASTHIPREKNAQLSISARIEGADKITLDITRPVINVSGSIESELVRSTSISYEKRIELFNDLYIISTDTQSVHIRHPHWTLYGEGKTVDEARDDLINTIKELREIYAQNSIDELTSQASEFREYLLNIFNP